MNENEFDPREVTRPPVLEDLVRICRHLNEEGAQYILIGGIAMLEHGLARMTEDIDLLIDPSEDNVARVKRALTCLPDHASEQLEDSDIAKFVVVRVNDEITVDLMGEAGGVSFAAAAKGVEWRIIEGVRVPFASPALLWRTKQSNREKDRLDRAFLAKRFSEAELNAGR